MSAMPSHDNPFWVQTPDQIPPNEATHLFVDMFTEFPQVEAPAHSFIVGPRGSGKSMMFRVMRPDCLTIRLNRSLQELPYLGVYVPIKSTRITATEMQMLDNHPARYVFNEHWLCLYIAIYAFHELSSAFTGAEHSWNLPATQRWMVNLSKRLIYCGVPENATEELLEVKWNSYGEVFSYVATHLDDVYWSQADQLFRNLALERDRLGQYRGPLFSYHGFLFPILAALQELPGFPNKPIYLLIDDADNLNLAQTEVVNSWLATRSTKGICLKLSDQMGYKTFLSSGGKRIQNPHDFNLVDVSVLYTTQRDKYLDRLAEIVRKRLAFAAIEASPENFFPEDVSQVEKLNEIQAEYKAKWQAGEGRGARDRDDVTRYARPELMRRLRHSKSLYTYSYAGFEQLAHISSGVVRYFLEPAATMYSKIKTLNTNVTYISPSVQDDVIKAFSNDFLDVDLVAMRKDAGALAGDFEKLLNLIEVMGESFAMRLTDDRLAEQRVFSIALSDRPDDEVQRILDLGTKEGFFYRSTLGVKRGSGRTSLYVLSRRLAPRFKLDPTSFAGYLTVTGESLQKALYNRNHRFRESDEDVQNQLELGLPKPL